MEYPPGRVGRYYKVFPTGSRTHLRGISSSASVGCASSAEFEIPAPSLHADIKISTATLTEIDRHFAVCILIQAKEGSKAALFGRKSIDSAYDLASWTSGDNLLMVKIEIYFRISFIYRLHHHMLCFTLLVTTF